MEGIYQKYLTTSGVCTDTRNITKDCFFVALKGANFNGNLFAEQALQLGAKYVLVDENQNFEDDGLILVDDCLVALQRLANHHRKQFDLPVIGITGSNGKTSTKELINAVLAKKYNVLATIGNLNNHIGVPLTLLRLNSSHEIAIIEMGANKFKDIEELCDIAEPNFGIITNIGKAHLEGFLNFEGVLKTKLELYKAVEQNKGELFVNGDDAVLTENVPKNVSTFIYGKNPGSAVKGTLERLNPFVELNWSHRSYNSPSLSTQIIGEYNFYNFLAAISVGVRFGVDPEKIDQAIATYTPTNNRSQVQKTLTNTVIVDCYNANPSSMASALSSFVQIDATNKLLILGDMRELGAEEKSEHEKIIQFVNEHELRAYFVGPTFSKMHLIPNRGFASTSDLLEHLENSPIENQLILLKGSRGIALEKTLDKL